MSEYQLVSFLCCPEKILQSDFSSPHLERQAAGELSAPKRIESIKKVSNIYMIPFILFIVKVFVNIKLIKWKQFVN